MPATTAAQTLDPHAVAQQFPQLVTSHAELRHGGVVVFVTNGTKVARFTTERDGRIYVSLCINYGPADGRAHCDSGTYKTLGGAVRKARAFLSR